MVKELPSGEETLGVRLSEYFAVGEFDGLESEESEADIFVFGLGNPEAELFWELFFRGGSPVVPLSTFYCVSGVL